MAVMGTLIGEFTALFTGLDLDAMTQKQWAVLIGQSARRLQQRVAKSFAAQKTAGNVWLASNDPKYTASKVRVGLDWRRGHRTNYLQGILNTARLFMVSITPQANGQLAARVVMEEGMLHNLVPYSVSYEEKKVRTNGILSLAALWVREEAEFLRRREMAALAKKPKVNRGGQQALRVGIAARRANAMRILDRALGLNQNVLRAGLSARQANAAKILGRIR